MSCQVIFKYYLYISGTCNEYEIERKSAEDSEGRRVMAAKKTVKPVAVASAATTPKAEAKKTETPAEVKTEVKAETKKAEAPAEKTEVKAEKPAAVKKETVKKEDRKSVV